jgi:transcriptional regulator with XRE-family HTH domain
MRHNILRDSLRAARRNKGLSQSALAVASGAGRVTIARLEAGTEQDFRIGTLERICAALDLELAALPRGTQPTGEAGHERERAQRLDARRRHAALAAGLLALPEAKAAELIGQARENVDRWEHERQFDAQHLSRWRARLEGPVRTVALHLLEHGEWTDALLRNSPWSFVLEPAAP